MPPVLADDVVYVAPLLDYPDKLALLGSINKKRSLPSNDSSKRASFVQGDIPASCDADKVIPACRGDLYGTTGFKTKADGRTIGISVVDGAVRADTDAEAGCLETETRPGCTSRRTCVYSLSDGSKKGSVSRFGTTVPRAARETIEVCCPLSLHCLTFCSEQAWSNFEMRRAIERNV